jgi:hypothetical protein
MSLARRTAAPLAGIAIALALWGAARHLDEVARGAQLGPGLWPRLVLGGLALACLARIVVEWRGRHAGTAGGPDDAPPAISWPRLGLAVAAIVFYVLAVPAVGFALSTAAFIVSFMWLGGARSAPVIGLNAVVGTIALLYVFIKIVYLPLPKGDGPFEALTLALYRALGIF